MGADDNAGLGSGPDMNTEVVDGPFLDLEWLSDHGVPSGLKALFDHLDVQTADIYIQGRFDGAFRRKSSLAVITMS